MPIVSQGNSVVVDVGAHDGLWIKSTGSAEVTVNQVYAGTPEVINVTTDTGRVGFYGEPVTVSIRAVSGNADYQDTPDKIYPLTSVQGGQRSDSSPLDIAQTVNQLIDEGRRELYRNTGAVKIGGGLGSLGFGNRTTQATFLLRRRPARMRVHLLNAQANPTTGVKASIAPSANQTVWYEPSGGVAAFSLLTLSSTTIPAASAGTLANAVPSEVVSEWFNPRSIARNDGGSGFIFMLRVYCDAASNGPRMQLGGTVPTSDFAKYEARGGFGAAAGDFVTTAGVMTEDGSSCPAFYLEVEYETPVATVAIVGDSIMQGANADPSAGSAAYGAAFQALQRLAANGKSVQLFNSGWAGASTNNGTAGQLPTVIGGYLGQFMAYVSGGGRPTIAAFCPWSVNNAFQLTVEQINSVRQSIGVFVSLCEKNDIRPALVTPAPRNGYTVEQEAFRRQYVEYTKSYCQQNAVLLIDRDAVYTNYSSPTGGYKLPEWCIDDIHPTNAGHTAESYEWELKLNQVL